MLSKKLLHDVHTHIFNLGNHFCPSLFYHQELSACLYTGDMKIDVKSSPIILDFLKMSNERLLLFQIPHHGSPYNSSTNYLQSIPSDLFFWHDKDYSRINKNTSVVNNIQPPYRLILIDTALLLLCVIST